MPLLTRQTEGPELNIAKMAELTNLNASDEHAVTIIKLQGAPSFWSDPEGFG
jgi:hypothetical protein